MEARLNNFSNSIHLPRTRFEGTVNDGVDYSYQSRSIQGIQIRFFILSVSSKASDLHLVHPSTVEPFLPCQSTYGYHEQSPVNVDGWCVLKTWSPNIYLQLDCSPYSKIEGRCPFQMKSNNTTKQTVSMT